MAKNNNLKQNSLPLSGQIPIVDNFYSNEDFQFEKPVWDNEKCIRCGVCYLSCPDSAIHRNKEGYYEADLKLCKGCGLCSANCWTGCIAMEVVFKRALWLTR